jgi:DNA polymerase (family 10)
MMVLAEVASETTPGVKYEIRRTPQGNLTCSCPSWKYCRTVPRTCKHLRAYRPPEPEKMELEVARRLAAQVMAILQPKVARACVAGSVRRMKPLVKDIDIVAQPKVPPEELGQVLEAAGGQEVHVAPATVNLIWQGAKVEVYLASAEEYCPLLLWRTGPAESNIRLASRAKALGLEIRKTGVMRGEERLAWRTEPEMFAALQMPYRKPEERS